MEVPAGVLVGAHRKPKLTAPSPFRTLRNSLGARVEPPGELSERLKEHDWKSCVSDEGTVGSNPTLSASLEGCFVSAFPKATCEQPSVLVVGFVPVLSRLALTLWANNWTLGGIA